MTFCTGCGTQHDLSLDRCSSCSMKIPAAAFEPKEDPLAGKDRWQKKYCSPRSSTSRLPTSKPSTPTHLQNNNPDSPRDVTPKASLLNPKHTSFFPSTSASPTFQTTPTSHRKPVPPILPRRPVPSSLNSFSISISSAACSSPEKPLPPLPSNLTSPRQPTTSLASPPPVTANIDVRFPLLRTKSSDSIGSLQKVMGSVLEKRTPEQARCVECKEAFGKISGSGGTIYPVEGCDPASSDARFLCRGCYVESHKKGDCETCKLPVLGIKGDPAMKVRDYVWHEKCFVCVGCSLPATLLNLASAPSCESCFFTPSTRPVASLARPSARRSQTATSNLGGFASSPRLIATSKPSTPKASFAPSSAPSTPGALRSPSVLGLASRFNYEPASPSIPLPPYVPANPAPSRSSTLIEGTKSTRSLEIRPNAPSRTSSYLAGPRSPALKDPYSFLPNLGASPSAASGLSSPSMSNSPSLVSGFSTSGSEASLASVDKGSVADDVVIQGVREEKEEDKQPDDRKREWSGELKLEDLLSELEGGKWGGSEVEEKVAAPLEQRKAPTDLSTTVRFTLTDSQNTKELASPSKVTSPLKTNTPSRIPVSPLRSSKSPSSAPAMTTVALSTPVTPILSRSTKEALDKASMPPPPLPFTGAANRTHSDSASLPANNFSPFSSPSATASPSRPSYAKHGSSSSVSTTGSARKYGVSLSCPSCAQPVSLYQPDVVSGSAGLGLEGGDKWHKSCLSCGGGVGKGPVKKGTPRKEKNDGTTGCGRSLDAGAKVDGNGNVWCRGCLDDIRRAQRPLTQSYTGGFALPSPSGMRDSSSHSKHSSTSSLSSNDEYRPSSLSRSVAAPPSPSAYNSFLPRSPVGHSEQPSGIPKSTSARHKLSHSVSSIPAPSVSTNKPSSGSGFTLPSINTSPFLPSPSKFASSRSAFETLASSSSTTLATTIPSPSRPSILHRPSSSLSSYARPGSSASSTASSHHRDGASSPSLNRNGSLFGALTPSRTGPSPTPSSSSHTPSIHSQHSKSYSASSSSSSNGSTSLSPVVDTSTTPITPSSSSSAKKPASLKYSAARVAGFRADNWNTSSSPTSSPSALASPSVSGSGKGVDDRERRRKEREEKRAKEREEMKGLGLRGFAGASASGAEGVVGGASKLSKRSSILEKAGVSRR